MTIITRFVKPKWHGMTKAALPLPDGSYRIYTDRGGTARERIERIMSYWASDCQWTTMMQELKARRKVNGTV